MNIKNAFPSHYLKTSEIGNNEVTVFIERVDIETLDDEGGAKQKPVMYFQGKKKGLVLNKTNAETIAMSYGDDTDFWVGKPIIIFSQPNVYQGQPGLRVRIPRKSAAATPPPAETYPRTRDTAAAPTSNGETLEEFVAAQPATGDDIPF